MPFNEAELTKGQVRKLNALRKSIGDDLAGEVFGKWLQRQASGKLKEQQDLIADRIAEALAELATDPTFKLGNYGYTVVRARGKGASGLSVRKNTKPISDTGGSIMRTPDTRRVIPGSTGGICQDHKPAAQSGHNPTS